jgi:hypothetical protein
VFKELWFKGKTNAQKKKIEEEDEEKRMSMWKTNNTTKIENLH